MKRLIMAALVIANCAALYAQNSFFPPKAGMTLTYANSDAAGNTESYLALAVTEVTGAGGNMTVTYAGTGLDKSRKPVSGAEMTYRVVVKNGAVILDMNQVIPAEMRAQGVKIDVSGTPVEVPGPNDLKPGTPLKPAEITLTMDLGVMKMNSVIKIEGKCLAVEDVKVPAGTFKCHKITQKATTSAMGANIVQTTLSWYAPDVGLVKSETYDDKNILVSGSALVEVKGR